MAALGEVRVGQLVVGQFQAHVERLEHVGRQVLFAERIRQRFGSLRRVPPIRRTILDEVRHLLLDRQVEERGGDIEHLVEQRLFDPMARDREESRGSSRMVELCSHHHAIGVGALQERLQVDRIRTHDDDSIHRRHR